MLTLQPRPEKINGMTLTAEPLDHVYFKMHLTFVFRDADGFEIARLTSKDETLSTGDPKTFQNKIESTVPYAVAMKTAKIEVAPYIFECLSCDSRK